MPAPVIIGAAAEIARRLEDALRQWERSKCRIGGRRLRTACKTVSPSDQQAFMAGQTVQYLVSERAADLQNAWGVPVDGSPASVTRISGLSYADMAHLHTSAFVPVCLEAEAGHHTCHPEENPGREYYEVSRLLLQDHIRSGRIYWRGLPRGGGAGDILPGDGVHERIDCGKGGKHAGTEACSDVPIPGSGPGGGYSSGPVSPGGTGGFIPGGTRGATPRPKVAGLGSSGIAILAGVALLILMRKG